MFVYRYKPLLFEQVAYSASSSFYGYIQFKETGPRSLRWNMDYIHDTALLALSLSTSREESQPPGGVLRLDRNFPPYIFLASPEVIPHLPSSAPPGQALQHGSLDRHTPFYTRLKWAVTCGALRQCGYLQRTDRGLQSL